MSNKGNTWEPVQQPDIRQFLCDKCLAMLQDGFPENPNETFSWIKDSDWWDELCTRCISKLRGLK